jgi:antitoxin component of MazEF toxin-antitoxin module
MKTQKIIKVGNSLAVTLPAAFVRDGNLKIGDELVVETAPVYQTMLIKTKKMAKEANLTPEFFDWLNKFTKENYDLLKELSKTP